MTAGDSGAVWAGGGQTQDRPGAYREDEDPQDPVRQEAMYGDFQPEGLVARGLPKMVEGIAPGEWFPLALCLEEPDAAVLYVHRRRPGESSVPDRDYEHNILHLRRSAGGGWTRSGHIGGSWINPFSPPESVVEKYLVICTKRWTYEVDGASIRFSGGFCSRRIEALEVEEDGLVRRYAIDRQRRTFIVGTKAPSARLRFVAATGGLVHDHDGTVLEFDPNRVR